MAVYDVNGNELITVYDATGSILTQAYDTDGNELLSSVTLPLDYLTPATQTNEYAANTLVASDVYDLYDELVGTKADGYTVTKTLLGIDQSETYNIYKYVFTPANYTRTILLSTGMHGIEITPIFTILTMMQDIVNNPATSTFHRYMRESVRVVLVPLQNPWGFSQIEDKTIVSTTGRIYGNYLWVNENRNFAITDEWEAFDAPAYGAASHPYDGKGEAPFDQNETQHMRDVLIDYMNDIDFWFDCHTSMGWNYDYYVQCNATDTTMYNAISDAITNSVRPYLIANAGKTESTIRGLFNDPNTALKLHYAWLEKGVSCCTVEMTPKRFGGSECGSVDLQFYLQQFSSYLISALNAFN